VALDPKHLPEDPKVLQQMVLDLMSQLDREFTERNKIETLLRELLDAKRNRKSEQLSADQLALFASARQARQAEAEPPAKPDRSDDDDATTGTGNSAPQKRAGGRQPAESAGPFPAMAVEPSGRALIAELGPDEFLVMGFGSAVEFRPVQGSAYTAAQLVSNEQGVYENGVWRTTVPGQTAQGDYTGPIITLPETGALVKVKLMKY